MSAGCALCIPAADDRAGARVLALEQPAVPAHTGVAVTTIHIIRAARLLDTQTVLAAVQGRALGVVLALGNAAASVAELVVQTVPGGLAGRRADAEAAEHAAGALLLAGAQLQLGAAQGGLASEAGQAEAARHVVESATVSVLAAHVGQRADIHALVADTGPLPGTVGVGHALQLHAPHIGVAVGAGRAGAHRLVVGGGADSVRPAGARSITRVLTLAVVAGGGAGTVRVGQALVRGLAAAELVRHRARGTLALVRADGVNTDGGGLAGAVLTLVYIHTPVVGEDVAWLAPAAGLVVVCGAGAPPAVDLAARVHAAVVDDLADLVSAAVGVLLTLHLGAAQGGVGVAHVLVRAAALRPVVHHLALAVGAAPGAVAWVDTLPVAAAVPGAGEAGPAVPVGAALVGILAAPGVGVAY